MDWINQNKVKNLSIVGLLIINVLTISTVWILVLHKTDEPMKSAGQRPSESVQLLQQELSLNSEQVKQLEMMRSNKLDLMKKNNDSLDVLKKLLAEELFKPHPDTNIAAKYAQNIGTLQAKTELLRFQHFNELLSMCTDKQKDKLKPVLIELFGKKPPKFIHEQQPESAKSRTIKEREKESSPPLPEEQQIEVQNRPAPPGVEEKLEKYSRRLQLSEQQKNQVREILSNTRKKSEALRTIPNADRDMIEDEKRKLKDAEDNAIMQLLTPEQKDEFSRMLAKRK
ncbi:MAG: hypothetical protein LWX56_05985 [Ignavibacteria bacterium]|nr:hypothetical protein [Ignavibacteria bacterium]